MLLNSLGVKLSLVTVQELLAELASNGYQAKEFRLATKPHARHWHITKPGEKGTLEITSDPKAQTVQIEVRSNRQGAWTGELQSRLIQQNLQSD